jgi:hypothetical protein
MKKDNRILLILKIAGLVDPPSPRNPLILITPENPAQLILILIIPKIPPGQVL